MSSTCIPGLSHRTSGENEDMTASRAPYYRRDLALVHHLGFGFHADRCAPGILRLLEPVRERNGLLVELGCGSGLLTKYLTDAGHRVVATDASPEMVALARDYAPAVESTHVLVLPDDPIPPADAFVSVGHVLSYLADEDAIERAFVAVAEALRPGGVVAVDICDLEYGASRKGEPAFGRAAEEWAIVTEFDLPAPNRFVRRIAAFLRNDDGSWRRDDERHDNVLVDTSAIPTLLAAHSVEASVGVAFGTEELPTGLHTIIGRKDDVDGAPRQTGQRSAQTAR
jgi:SAM-dependent methyltransferase